MSTLRSGIASCRTAGRPCRVGAPSAATAPHHVHGATLPSYPPHVSHVLHAQVHFPAMPHTPMHAAPTTPLRSRHQQRCQRTVPAAGDPLMGDIIAKPHEALGFALPLWTQLAGLVVANILGFQMVQKVMRNMGDKSEPLSVVELQLGLRGHTDLQRKLAEMSGMMQLGQQGSWIILEESILEITRYKSSCAYAAVSMTPQTSKTQAYELFNQRASMNRGQARREEERSSTTAVERWEASMDDDGVATGAKGLLGALTKSFRSMSEDKDEMVVVTMLVTCKGTLDVPSSLSSWSDVQHCLQQLCSLSSGRIMAIELIWTPRDEGRFLTESQLLADYPGMQSIQRQAPPKEQDMGSWNGLQRF